MSDYSFSFSGSDCHTFVNFMSPYLYGKESSAAKVKLDCINTISISVHEQRTPVRRLGHSGVVGFAGSVRTVAGSIIMTIVKDNPFDELITKSGIRDQWGARIASNDSGSEFYKDIKHPYNYKNPNNSYEYLRTNNSPKSSFKIQNLTTLPAMKFRMEFVSEYYRAKKQPYSSSINKNEERPLLRVMELHNVFIISENVVTSVNNMVTELVLQYVASDYVEFTEELTPQQVAQAQKNQVAPAPIAEEIKKTEPVIEQPKVVEPVVPAAPAVQNVPITQSENGKTVVVNSPVDITLDSLFDTPLVTSLPKATASEAVSETPQAPQVIQPLTPEVAPTAKTSNKVVLVRPASVEIPVEPKPTDGRLELFDSDLIDKIKTSDFNVNKQISSTLEDLKKESPESFGFNLLDGINNTSKFDFEEFKTKNYPNRALSDSNDSLMQPNLTLESPFFSIAAMVGKPQHFNLYRQYNDGDSPGRYNYTSKGGQLSTSLQNLVSASNTQEEIPPDISDRYNIYQKFYANINAVQGGLNYSNAVEALQKAKTETAYKDDPLNYLYSTPEDLLLNHSSTIIFDNSRPLDTQKEYLKHITENNLIPTQLIPLYTKLAKDHMYNSIENVFLPEDYDADSATNFEANPRLRRKKTEEVKEIIDKYKTFLIQTNQFKEKELKILDTELEMIMDKLYE